MAATAHAEVRATVNFSADQVTVTHAAAGDRVKVDGCRLRTTGPGQPDLPIRLYRLVVPADFEPTDVHIVRATFEPLESLGGFQIPTTRLPNIDDPWDMTELSAPDPEIYGRDAPFPSEPVQLSRSGFSFGYHVSTLLVHPLRYYPVSGRMEVLTELEFELGGARSTAQPVYALRRSARSAAAVERYMARIVDNDEALAAYAPPTRVESMNGRTGGARTTQPWPSLAGMPVDFVIITSDLLYERFELLAEWKIAKGLNTKIVTVSGIVSRYPGVDTQERIRNFIIDADQLWGTTWILLGGDVDQVPHRDWWSYPGVESRIAATDLYYSTMEGNWNADGDDRFGEDSHYAGNHGEDEADYDPDIHIGRAPAGGTDEGEAEAEAVRFVNKVLDYEKAPNSYPSYIPSFLLMGSSLGPCGTDYWGQDTSEYVANGISGWPGDVPIHKLYYPISDDYNPKYPTECGNYVEFCGDELWTEANAISTG
ncbi:MAG: hypothetical protein KAY37_15695 [Phycisphaerae bacterium]|nr:hypothetical protein [Phycisphaerae bacterium]